MNILYLYAELMPYTMATIKELTLHNFKIHVVHWDKKKQIPYIPQVIDNVTLYNRSELSETDLFRIVENLDPEITVVSGWMDREYLSIARKLRNKGNIVVTGIDNQWNGKFKQRFASYLGVINYFYFSHAWVAGTWQYEYARKIGFKKQNIIFDLYSADLDLFHSIYSTSIQSRRNYYPHRFLFVGRLEPVKGLDILIKAWELLEDKSDWELHIIGNGSLRKNLKNFERISIKEFMQPIDLKDDFAKAGCFVLPSRVEPWGVVIHESVAAGLPIITSNVVGASSVFLVNGLNGYSYEGNDVATLSSHMKKIISLSDEELLTMSANSYYLSKRITPETSSANLLSLISEKL